MPIALDDNSVDISNDNVASFNVIHLDTDLDEIEENTPTLSSQDVSYEHSEVLNDWCDIVKSNLDRFVAINAEVETVKKSIKDAFEFADNLIVPFNFEYARIHCIATFNHLLEECLILQSSVEKIPYDVEYQCMTAYESGCHQRRRKCIDYLDSMMLFYDISVSTLKDVVEMKSKQGMELYARTQLVSQPCGL